MHGRKGYRNRFSDVGVAIVLFAGLSLLPPFSLRAIRGDAQRDAKPFPPDLFTAIRDGDVQNVRRLLDNGADVNSRDPEGNTPLIQAAFYATPECVGLLLKKGADANAANSVGATALIRATTNYEKTRSLLDAGAKVRVRTTDYGSTPLILAARRAGNSRTVKLLLEHGANATEHDNAGISPIIAGAASNEVETVRLLLDAGAKPNDFPKSNDPRADAAGAGFRTPLMWASFYNNVPMTRLLLEHGADPNLSTYFGSPLSQACWADGFEAAEVLIDHGASVNSKDMVASFTPLHWAAGSELPRAHLVKLLLASGADPNSEGGETVGAFGLVPQTPLLIAQKRGRTAIVDALIAAGAKAQPYPEKIATPHRALPEKIENSALIDSAEKALAALQITAARSHESFLQHVGKQDCVSCHQQYLPMAAVGHARNRSVRFDHEAASEQIDLIGHVKNQFDLRERVIQANFHPDATYSFGYEMFGLAAEEVPPNEITDGKVHHLATIQAPDGRWYHNLPRPPIQADDVGATALSLYAIKSYGWPGRKDEFAARIEHARRWLWKVKAETNEEAIFQLLGLHWAGEPAERLTVLAKALLQKQRKDGGWAQLPMLESDAYATGQALYALSQTMMQGWDPMVDPAWQRGLRFLLERQEDDGTWHVARRTFPFQPTMNSGFSHHRDSWVSAAATSWSVLAMTQVLPIGSASGKPTMARPTHNVHMPIQVQKIDFARQIKPILERSCVGCHSGDMPKGQFRVESREAFLKGGATGEANLVPGHSEASLVLDYVSDKVPDLEMPPKAKRKQFPALSTDEIALLRAWIDEGADWPKDTALASPKVEAAR